jgi:hypothetical protein
LAILPTMLARFRLVGSEVEWLEARNPGPAIAMEHSLGHMKNRSGPCVTLLLLVAAGCAEHAPFDESGLNQPSSSGAGGVPFQGSGTGGTGGNLGTPHLATPLQGVFVPTGNMTVARDGHTATLLPNGKVLIAGGVTPAREADSSDAYLQSAELYDPVAGTFAATGSMSAGRWGHTATLLSSGKVLVVGGGQRLVFASAELYDPEAGTFAQAGTLISGRESHTATLLPSGKVLIAGGQNELGKLASAELYDPRAGTFTATGSMAVARYSHLAVALGNGKVLIAGGVGGNPSDLVVASAELYDPATGRFTATGSMTAARYGDTATSLPSGKVLIGGGDDGGPYLASAELYDSAAGAFAATGSMTVGRWSHAAALLLNGTVLFAGGESGTSLGVVLARAELYATDAGAFTATGNMTAARLGHTATLLGNGMVLIAGGLGSSGILASAELYQ